jgi:hypothetical protein
MRHVDVPASGEPLKNHVQHRIRSSLLAGTVVIAMGLIGGAAAAQAANCTVSGGVPQTPTTVTGTNGNDTITCAAGTTVTTINGNAGNDTITSANGLNSTINGGDGNDTITSGAGNDTINGGLGKDTISGSAGNDNLVGPPTPAKAPARRRHPRQLREHDQATGDGTGFGHGKRNRIVPQHRRSVFPHRQPGRVHLRVQHPQAR